MENPPPRPQHTSAAAHAPSSFSRGFRVLSHQTGGRLTPAYFATLVFFHCNAHAASPHFVNDDRPVRWHQSGGDPRLATPLSTPPVSSTRGTASARDGPESHTKSAITYAGFRGLSTGPSQTACRGHQRWDTFYNSRGQTAVSPPWLAVSLWTHRQGDACACRMRLPLYTFVAGLPGRYH